MKRPSNRKLLVFGALSVVYGCIAALIVAVISIRTCTMQPDVAATCDVTPINLTMITVAALYLALAFAFFRHRISGVD